MDRRHVLNLGAAALAASVMPRMGRAALPASPTMVMTDWYKLILMLVRHTATYSPPVAARSFGYLGVTVYEAVAACDGALTSLAGQLNGLGPVPDPEPGPHDGAIVLNAALAGAVAHFFSNTGPTGQRALRAITRTQTEAVTAAHPADVTERSTRLGQAVAAHIITWAATDGGAVVQNMGFPQSHVPGSGAGAWVPTSLVRQQQAPLLPGWGTNRPFAMPDGASCALPPPPAYSEEQGSAFHAEAMEVYTVTKALTPEQKVIARFWSDDPMLTFTPPGHWVSLARDIILAHKLETAQAADLMARLGIGLADAFIACWQAKFQYDLLRPVTYIQRVIDPAWQPLLITPPFPEYPSGHSTVSGSAATVLTGILGDAFAFDDATHVREGFAVRRYGSFWEAAQEAGMSRLYGGIHFRSGIERGLDQGRCVGAHALQLRTLA